ncbi:MAG: hypothetical protein V7K24_15295 [Nostoc sp.]
MHRAYRFSLCHCYQSRWTDFS